jgi:hypothetical protein
LGFRKEGTMRWLIGGGGAVVVGLGWWWWRRVVPAFTPHDLGTVSALWRNQHAEEVGKQGR